MELWIYTPDYELMDVCDTASSIIWTTRARQCGDFEIYVQASPEMLALLQEDRIVSKPGDPYGAIIEKVHIKTDEEFGDFITATGRSLCSIYDRRIVWEQTQISGTVENAMRRLVTDAYISPAIEARKYDKLTLADAHGYTDTVRAQYTGTVLLEALEKLSAAHGYGFTVKMQGGVLVADFYKGVDRSTGQSENTPVIFSEFYDTLITSAYTKDKTLLKNVALVAGEGEGSARKRATVTRDSTVTGLSRREMYIDARDVSSNEGEITDAEYLEQLTQRGISDLSEATEIESFEGVIQSQQQYTFGVDYNLGDLVTVVNKYGVQANAHVLEVMEVWDENGYTCTPTFG